VMGLAPYGKAAAVRTIFGKLYGLRPDGQYWLEPNPTPILREFGLPRKPDEEISQLHQDVAAGLQEALEAVMLHVLSHYRAKTGRARLCLAGGVAHNCSANGRIAESGLFEELFVQPAAHDAGCALGAALACSIAGDVARSGRLRHVYWGTPLQGANEIAAELEPWRPLVKFARVDNVVDRAAALMASGAILGWVQGRSEFGPRALGNRSILADPRPASHKDLINAMVKKREGFRPFAPAVIEERVADFFDIPPVRFDAGFMNVVVRVKPEHRRTLGAVTHVDGSARLQVVSRSVNERFWSLLEAFGRITGVPILLNTSFNNNAEPIVDSVLDAITCFATTGLDYLVIGDHVVSRGRANSDAYGRLFLSLPPHVSLRDPVADSSSGGAPEGPSLGNTHHDTVVPVSEATAAVLSGTDGSTRLSALLTARDAAGVLDEILTLWNRRLVVLDAQPRSRALTPAASAAV
jgi:carbamoyltransferase